MVLTPDSDPSFTVGFFEAKQNEAARKKAEEDAKERERQIWGGQQYWSPSDLSYTKSSMPSSMIGNGGGTNQKDRSSTFDGPPVSKRAGDPLFNRMTRTMFDFITNETATALGLIGINRFSPMLMLPGTRDLLKPQDDEA
jgi:hypothetical protein